MQLKIIIFYDSIAFYDFFEIFEFFFINFMILLVTATH